MTTDRKEQSMTAPDPQPPAAPETDVSALREAAYAILDLMPLDSTGHIAKCAWDDSDEHPACGCSDLPGQIAKVIATAARKRVRVVVEGERDAAASAARIRVLETAIYAQEQRARAESAEAAHEALRAGVEALAGEWEGWSKQRSTTRIDAFRDAAESLRALLVGDAR